MLSLPRILGTSLSSVPKIVPYLHADADLVDSWRGLMGEIRGAKCGIRSAMCRARCAKSVEECNHFALRASHYFTHSSQGNSEGERAT